MGSTGENIHLYVFTLRDITGIILYNKNNKKKTHRHHKNQSTRCILQTCL